MLSPNASIFGNLSHVTSKALLGLQRSTNKALSVSATEVAITKGNSGDASYSARMSSLRDRKKIVISWFANRPKWRKSKLDCRVRRLLWLRLFL